MKLLHSSSSHNVTILAKRQLLRSCLLLLLTSLLILWFSGGFPPTIWQLFFQAISQFSALQAKNGNIVILPLLLLAGQSLLLLLAWGIFFWILFCEVSYFLTMSNQAKQTAIPALPAVQPQTPSSLPKNVTHKNITPELAPQNNSISTNQSQPPTTIHQIPDEIWSTTSIDKQLDPDLQLDSAMPLLVETEEILENPFEVEPDEFDLYLQTEFLLNKNEKLAQTQPELDEEAAEISQESVQQFVFGNPFEGTLPDVFSYDTDLKRSIEELEVEAKNARTRPLNPKTNPLSARTRPLSPKTNPLSARTRPLSPKTNPLSARSNPLQKIAEQDDL